MITYLTGDATAPDGAGNKIIAHICNDIGAWGAGFVLAISARWKQPENDYRQWYKSRETNDFALGAVQLVQAAPDIWVANMVGQHNIQKSNSGPPIRYEAVESCLSKFAEHALELNASVHMPRIGCGLAGGKWELVEPLIVSKLCSREIQVFVYDFAK